MKSVADCTGFVVLGGKSGGYENCSSLMGLVFEVVSVIIHDPYDDKLLFLKIKMPVGGWVPTGSRR